MSTFLNTNVIRSCLTSFNSIWGFLDDANVISFLFPLRCCSVDNTGHKSRNSTIVSLSPRRFSAFLESSPLLETGTTNSQTGLVLLDAGAQRACIRPNYSRTSYKPSWHSKIQRGGERFAFSHQVFLITPIWHLAIFSLLANTHSLATLLSLSLLVCARLFKLWLLNIWSNNNRPTTPPLHPCRRSSSSSSPQCPRLSPSSRNCLELVQERPDCSATHVTNYWNTRLVHNMCRYGFC